jgi:hypothetical protein
MNAGSYTSEEVRQITRDAVNAALSELKISGPGVSGSGKNWLINPRNPKTPEESKRRPEPEPIQQQVAVAKQPFQLVYFLNNSDAHRCLVKYSTLASATPTTPTPDDNGDYNFAFVGGNKIYGKIVINETTGAVTSRTLVSQSTDPVDTDTDFYVEIGRMIQTGSGDAIVRSTSNARYGPIDAKICRDWYSNPVTYGVTWLGGSVGGGGYYYY